MDSDALLKSLKRNLDDMIAPRDLRAWSWSDFTAFDHDGKTAPALAAEALIYLGITRDGSWRDAPLIVQAVLAFVLEQNGRKPTAQELAELRGLLDDGNRQGIVAWFDRLF